MQEDYKQEEVHHHKEPRAAQQLVGNLVPSSTEVFYQEAAECLAEIKRDLNQIHDRYAEAMTLAGSLELTAIVQAEDEVERNL